MPLKTLIKEIVVSLEPISNCIVLGDGAAGDAAEGAGSGGEEQGGDRADHGQGGADMLDFNF